MNIESLVANVTSQTTINDIKACKPFIAEVTSFYPSGSGTDKYLHKGSSLYRTVDYSALLQALQMPQTMQSKFKVYSGTLE